MCGLSWCGVCCLEFSFPEVCVLGWGYVCACYVYPVCCGVIAAYGCLGFCFFLCIGCIRRIATFYWAPDFALRPR